MKGPRHSRVGGAKRSFTQRKLLGTPILPHPNAFESGLRAEWPYFQIQIVISIGGGSLLCWVRQDESLNIPNLRVIQPVVESLRAAEALKLPLDLFRFFYY